MATRFWQRCMEDVSYAKVFLTWHAAALFFATWLLSRQGKVPSALRHFQSSWRVLANSRTMAIRVASYLPFGVPFVREPSLLDSVVSYGDALYSQDVHLLVDMLVLRSDLSKNFEELRRARAPCFRGPHAAMHALRLFIVAVNACSRIVYVYMRIFQVKGIAPIEYFGQLYTLHGALEWATEAWALPTRGLYYKLS